MPQISVVGLGRAIKEIETYLPSLLLDGPLKVLQHLPPFFIFVVPPCLYMPPPIIFVMPPFL